MRIAVLTDLHANLQSLTRILEECEKRGADRVVCLGDTVGYGGDPNAVCDLVRERAEVAILGNHDAAAIGRMDRSLYYDAAREALDWTQNELSEENAAWLRALPFSWREGEVLYSHGSPADPEAYEYIFAVDQARELVPLFTDTIPDGEGLPRITFIGHSHLCRVYAYTGGDVSEVRAENFAFRKGYRYLVSVGSGGQPRDYDPRACFAIYDQDAQSVEFLRVEYDIAGAARRILEMGLSPNFARRLFVGM